MGRKQWDLLLLPWNVHSLFSSNAHYLEYFAIVIGINVQNTDYPQ